jgi:hypothetical protein
LRGVGDWIEGWRIHSKGFHKEVPFLKKNKKNVRGNRVKGVKKLG